MAHGKSLELQKLRPRLRMWRNTGGLTVNRDEWAEMKRRIGWDEAPRIKVNEKNPAKA